MSAFSYTKLFSGITESTLWCEPAGTRLVWITLLAKCDMYGRFSGSLPGLARLANVSLTETALAVETLLAPDIYSRTPDYEGRRIEAIGGGWRLLNHEKYRDMRDEEKRRAQNCEAQRRHRERSAKVIKSADSEPPVSRSSRMSAHASTTATATATATATTTATKVQEEQKRGARSALLVLPDWLPADVWSDWDEYRKTKTGKAWTHKAQELSLGKLTKLREEGFDPSTVIRQSIERGWSAFFAIKPEHLGSQGQPRRESLTERSTRLNGEYHQQEGMRHERTALLR